MLAIERTNLFGLGTPLGVDLPSIPTPTIPSSVTGFPEAVLKSMREDMFQPIGESFSRVGDGVRKFGTGFLILMALGIGGWLTVRILMGRPQLYFINAESARR
jgi:hypothetical protein